MYRDTSDRWLASFPDQLPTLSRGNWSGTRPAPYLHFYMGSREKNRNIQLLFIRLLNSIIILLKRLDNFFYDCSGAQQVIAPGPSILEWPIQNKYCLTNSIISGRLIGKSELVTLGID